MQSPPSSTLTQSGTLGATRERGSARARAAAAAIAAMLLLLAFAGPASAKSNRNVSARHFANDVDELPHRPTSTGTDIHGCAAATTRQVLYRTDVRIGKIRNMDVVADACTIGWRQDAILNFGKNKSLACDVVRG